MYLDETITHQNGTDPKEGPMAAEGPGCLHQAATRIFLVVPERPTREQEAAGRGTGYRRCAQAPRRWRSFFGSAGPKAPKATRGFEEQRNPGARTVRSCAGSCAIRSGRVVATRM